MSHAIPEEKVSSAKNVLRCWAPRQILPLIRKPFISLPTSHASSASLPHPERQKCQTHDRWVKHPELRRKYCLQVLHNKDGLHQHLKTCRHNPERPQQQYMCRNPGCGSVFSLLKKGNYHETHRCHLLKKNIGRGRSQPQ